MTKAKTQRKGQTYRHMPAFILLFLARENLYGGALLSKMQNELPVCRADSAVIYRTLQDLQDEGLVDSYWETDVSGPPRKWYQITEAGTAMLGEYRDDIAARIRNLEFFLDLYEQVTNTNKYKKPR